MKISLILLTCIALSSTTFAEQSPPCSITLKTAKFSSKSAKLKGVSFSAKQILALRSVCSVKIAPMTKADKLEAYAAKLEIEEADMKSFLETK